MKLALLWPNFNSTDMVGYDPVELTECPFRTLCETNIQAIEWAEKLFLEKGEPAEDWHTYALGMNEHVWASSIDGVEYEWVLVIRDIEKL